MTFWQWALFYLAPALAAFFLTKNRRLTGFSMLVIHACLLVSIVLLSTTGTRLSWQFQNYYVVLAVLSSIFSIYLLGTVGLGYALSSIIQEWCLLLAGTLLWRESPLLLAAFLSSLVYALAHVTDRSHWRWKVPLTLFWGTGSILLYAWLHQPLLNVALHISGGAFLIYKGFLYEKSAIKRGSIL